MPSILEENEQWLVLEKPASMHTIARADDPDDASVEGWLRTQRPDLDPLEESGLVHRLDYGTSGCLLVARTAEEQVRLRGGMRDGSIGKTYHALVVGGLPETGHFRLSFTNRYKRSRKVTVSESGELRSMGTCTWRVHDRTSGMWLLEIDLQGPGRRHQVRAGFAHLGAPLLGDTLYGGVEWVEQRPALHAAALLVDGRTITSPSPLAEAVHAART